jgi:conjugal transfer pilin signal peptidase TrbI
MKLRINKEQVIALLIILASVLAISHITNRLIYTISDSLNYSLFIKSAVEDIQHDQYVSFEFVGDEYYPEKSAFAKRVACLPAEYLEYSNSTWICNGKQLKNGRYRILQSKSGKNLPLFQHDGVIPDGKYFVLGDKSNSYDSKYWGFVDQSSIKYALKPLW